MSYTTKTSDVSETDSENRYKSRQHSYNTRYSSKNPSARQVYTTQKRDTSKSVAGHPSSYNTVRAKGDFPSNEEDVDDYCMDYCYDPCETPPRTKRFGGCCVLLQRIFYIMLLSTVVWIGFSQYLMNKDIRQLKEEMYKIRGGNRKEDPHVKLSKELDKKCSDTLKLLLKDPVGRPDFALESSGGRVVSVDTDPYSSPRTFLGINLCEGHHPPSSMIQATTSPGECWAFRGRSAKAILQLIDDVLVDSVTLEHIPASISPSGSIDTAPKDFRIWGLDEPSGNKKLLGQFTYEKDKGCVQTFNINNESGYYRYVGFEILSNHGNKEFTCVYRIRVHGTLRNDNI